eukprot:10126-Heterococcus_DN1.PRE.3
MNSSQATSMLVLSVTSTNSEPRLQHSNDSGPHNEPIQACTNYAYRTCSAAPIAAAADALACDCCCCTDCVCNCRFKTQLVQRAALAPADQSAPFCAYKSVTPFISTSALCCFHVRSTQLITSHSCDYNAVDDMMRNSSATRLALTLSVSAAAGLALLPSNIPTSSAPNLSLLTYRQPLHIAANARVLQLTAYNAIESQCMVTSTAVTRRHAYIQHNHDLPFATVLISAAALSSGHSAKLNRAAKRIALSTLNGSSRNVTAGGRGVLRYV